MQTLKQKFIDAGQAHVFKYFDSFTDEEKSALLAQLEQVDLDELKSLNDELLFSKQNQQQ